MLSEAPSPAWGEFAGEGLPQTFPIAPWHSPQLVSAITLSGPKVEVQRSQDQGEEEDDYSLWRDGDFLKSFPPAVLLRRMAP